MNGEKWSNYLRRECVNKDERDDSIRQREEETVDVNCLI
jgi:hypothetical protein